MKINTNARVWAAPIITLLGFGLLAGCGGGGVTGGNPDPTPSPSASAVVGVTAQFYDMVDPAYAGRAAAEVKWGAPPFTPVANVVEYHIYRNNTILGVTSRGQTRFIDAAGESFAPPTIGYYAVSQSDNTKLTLVSNVPIEPGLVYGTPVTYRVTALYTTPDTASSATPEYAETEIGTSNTLTPEK